MTEKTDHAVPSGAVLLHIGPHKTGTTAIQGALRQARPHLVKQGVTYPGTERSHHEQTRWAINPNPSARYGPDVQAIWEMLCDETQRLSDSRVVISSEMLDLATPDQAATIVQRLGGDRVHVVVTLRPLGAMLPSIWQQGIHGRRDAPYEPWLREIFSGDRSDERIARFWHQHQHDQLIRRWMDVVGPDRMHIVVVDKAAPTQLYTAFEQLLDLAEGTLQAPEVQSNRSLTATEVELIRRVNLEFRSRGLKGRKYRPFIREGLNMELKLGPRDPSPDPRIGTPPWALEAAAETVDSVVADIRSLGISVIGDLESLRVPQQVSPNTVLPETITQIPIDLAVNAIIGTMNGANADSDLAKARQRAERILADDSSPQVHSAPPKRKARFTRSLRPRR